MNLCNRCITPDTRPDTEFVDGVCSACLAYDRRPVIDWPARRQQLQDLLDRHNGRCIVPSSGGKDSHYQVLALLDMGADVTVVTATTCHLTPIGRMNIDNLARHARTVEYTPNMTTRAKLNRIALEMVGDISWPEHVSIFTTPFRAAVDLRIPLIFYGECPQNQYGGPLGSEDAQQLTLRWRSEFGGFLGLRPFDLVGLEGLSRRDMADYELPPAPVLETVGVEAHFLGQYIEWDSHRNARIAAEAGMLQVLPCDANWWPHENLDNLDTYWHDVGMYVKYGYGRLTMQVSADIRSGLLTRDKALRLVKGRDGLRCEMYAGVSVSESAARVGLTVEQLEERINEFKGNWAAP